VGYGNPHGVHAVPGCGAEPAGAVLLHLADDLSGEGIRVAEADEHLVQHDVVEDPHSCAAGKVVRHAAGEGAAAFDHFRDAVASETFDRRIDGKAAGTAGRFGNPVVIFAGTVGRLRVISRAQAHGGVVGGAIANQGDTAIVGDV